MNKFSFSGMLMTTCLILTFEIGFHGYISPRQTHKQEVVYVSDNTISEYTESLKERQALSPIVFQVTTNKYAYIKIPNEKEREKYLCSQSIGSSFTIETVGYILTNNHVVDTTNKDRLNCFQDIADKRSSSVEDVDADIKTEYILTNDQGHSFLAKVVHTFPKIDTAVIQVPDYETEILNNWKFIPFRSHLINVADGKVMNVEGNPNLLSDEPVATLGFPLTLNRTLIKGMIGNTTFTADNGITYVHFIAPTTNGNSGGPLYAPLDHTIIGMTSCVKTDDNDHPTSQAGAISFLDLQKALASVGLK